MYDRYSLVLMLTHACNLRCRYCYMGRKSDVVMPEEVGKRAIGRAVASLNEGGELELGFFGGEPLLEAGLLGRMIGWAMDQARTRRLRVRMGLTTNGTQTHAEAWRVMMRRDMDLAISCDGMPEVHDRHRRYAGGEESADVVVGTIRRLVAEGREFRVVSVVRPDTLGELCDSVRFLRSLGVRHIEPSLDLWTRWSEEDEARLERGVADLAEVWREGLPDNSIGWFGEKTCHLAELTIPPATRCGFGDGAVAVAPSGNLYPCERLIGEDRGDSPMRLAGNALEGGDFLHLRQAAKTGCQACGECAMSGMCNTFCRCSNYARTGDPQRPDRLLCRWNQACLEHTARILGMLAPEKEQ